ESAKCAKDGVSKSKKQYANFKRNKQIEVAILEDADYYSTICIKHDSVCHDHCGLNYTPQVDDIFKGCWCMQGTDICSVCRCDHRQHYHAMEKWKKLSKKFCMT